MVDQPCEIGVLFADIADSTRLYGLLGDEAALSAIEKCLITIGDVAKVHGGTIVKSIGDELMVAFPKPTDLFEAAIAIQRAVSRNADLSADGEIKLELRVGFHFGPAIMAGGDYYGDTVNFAARLGRIARAGQVIMSSEMTNRLTPAQLGATRSLARFAVKGRPQEMRILEVLWQDSANITAIGTVFDPGGGAGHRQSLQLSYEDTELVFDGPVEITIGRGPSNDLVVAHHRVSRRHATISFRQDNWVLRDHSTNGSFVTFHGEQEIALHLGELVLYKSGVTSLGLAAGSPAGAEGFALLKHEVRPIGPASGKP